VSPWLLGYADRFDAASATASVIGLVVLFFSVHDYFFPDKTDEWADAVLGAALVASPFILGYAGNSRATLNALVCGLLVTGFAVWALQRLRGMDTGPNLHVTGF